MKSILFDQIYYKNHIELKLFERVYQGSGVKFDAPSLKYIGGGQGSHVYGWGLYFTNSKDIAEWYAQDSFSLSKEKKPEIEFISYKLVGSNELKTINVRDVMIEYWGSSKSHFPIYYINSFIVLQVSMLIQLKKPLTDFKDTQTDQYIRSNMAINATKQIVEYIQSIIPESIKVEYEKKENAPYLYEIEINDKILPYLAFWTKPFDEQPESVKKGIISLLKDEYNNFQQVFEMFQHKSFGILYEKLRRDFQESSEDVSKCFLEHGIYGNRYPARLNYKENAKEGEENYVIFTDDPEVLKTINRKELEIDHNHIPSS